MTPCEICGRPVDGVGMFSEAHVDPSHFDDCYRIGWEREKARADKAEAATATLREVGKRMMANPADHCTAHPIWCVQERERDYLYDEPGSDTFVWLNDDHFEVNDGDELHRLNAHWDEHDEAPDGYLRVGYRDRWVTVTMCFSWEGADDYLRVNGHNLTDPRVYVMSLHRNAEMIGVREALMALAKGAA